MCDPLSLTIAATAMAAVGTGVSAISANNQARYQGKIADMNATAASAQAADANERGKLDMQSQMRKNAQLAGAQRLAMSANGIEADFGSSLDLQKDTASLAAEDYATIAKNTEREMQGFDMSATNYKAEGRAQRAAGKAALVKGVFDIGSTILGGAQQVSKIKAARAGGN
ncbi:MAG: virion core protein, T7 gp14 family [Beijerinckiaceae bacterium]